MESLIREFTKRASGPIAVSSTANVTTVALDLFSYVTKRIGRGVEAIDLIPDSSDVRNAEMIRSKVTAVCVSRQVSFPQAWRSAYVSNFASILTQMRFIYATKRSNAIMEFTTTPMISAVTMQLIDVITTHVDDFVRRSWTEFLSERQLRGHVESVTATDLIKIQTDYANSKLRHIYHEMEYRIHRLSQLMIGDLEHPRRVSSVLHDVSTTLRAAVDSATA